MLNHSVTSRKPWFIRVLCDAGCPILFCPIRQNAPVLGASTGDWGKPGTISVDNGPEYISKTLRIWAEKHGVTIQHIQPVQPQQNVYVERYNWTVRYKWLGQYVIESIEEAQDQALKWLWPYNNDRPNMGIGGITLAMKLLLKAARSDKMAA